MSDFIQRLIEHKKKIRLRIVEPEFIEKFCLDLFAFLFIRDFADESKTREAMAKLREDFLVILSFVSEDESSNQKIAQDFFNALPDIFEKSILDAEAIYNADPAAESIREVYLAYPSFLATFIYRIAHQIYVRQLSLLARLFSEYAHSKTGIDIHPAARIGGSLAIDHGTGIVIGATAVIGDEVKIYQGVTLGALSVQKDKALEKRHPTIQDRVVIYAGATILGGNTVIGADSIIGGNVWITSSIPSQSVVLQEDRRLKIENRKSFKNPIDFTI